MAVRDQGPANGVVVNGVVVKRVFAMGTARRRFQVDQARNARSNRKLVVLIEAATLGPGRGPGWTH